MFKYVRCCSLVLVVGAMASPAFAQSTGRFALGATVGRRVASDPAAGGATTVGLLWRFGHGEGWRWAYGLNWFDTDIERSIGGLDTEFGNLRVRPLMGGYGYTRRFGPAAVSANILAGYAFTTFKMTPTASDAFVDRLGARSLAVDAANTLVLKPGVELWYDLSEKIGLKVEGGYMIARPKITVTSTLGEDTRRFRADMFIFKVGAVYSIF